MEAGSEGTDPARVVITRRVEWIDTDAAGQWHFGMAFRLCEAAESALWERIGIRDQMGRLPRIHVEASFQRPLRFMDYVHVDLRVAAVGRTSLTFSFEVRHEATGEAAAHGRMVVVSLDEDGEKLPIPQGARDVLTTAGTLEPDLVRARPASDRSP